MKKDKNWLKETLKKRMDYWELNVAGGDYGRGRSDETRELLKAIDQLEEPEQEKVVVPQFVADFIGKNFGDSCPKAIEDAVYYMDKFNEWHEYNRIAKEKVFSDRFTEELGWWLSDNMVLFYKACTNGYSVEKEKMYRVVFPMGINPDKLIRKISTGAISIDSESYYSKDTNDEFTEQEIKAIDERYWAFAEEITK